ncbi:hypothetical protein FK535_14745 [Mycolicibacterium sp. 018/SC-01/001]|uniref:hypothetical protein n=1 Tax=Mycolicibacterium sp. 018/SC-01/001 TaxID=2592069 RepID=UPI00117D29F8|nr:hypothetical protein [Mycolicibacterium sp. 018/SC-01/001]TRW82131.1 hypothetical protein FK535_14745 [Mycolicibacterium sp. 018/SC-01/001]
MNGVPQTVGVNAARWALVAMGVVIGVYGAWQLWALPVSALVRVGIWAAAGVIVHDFVFAPLTAALGYTSRRLITGRWWPPVAVAAMCSVTLVLLAVPVVDTPGAKPDNPSVLDRDYPLGLGVALTLVWLGVPLWQAIRLLSRRRR